MKTLGVSSALSLSFIHLATCQQQFLGTQPLLRDATLEDADDIASVIIAAFSPLSTWQYLYQFREKYPEEHHRCVRYGVTQALAAASYHVDVIETPPGSSLSIAAVAIWQHDYLEDGIALHQLPKKCEHRDTNITRGTDYDYKITAAKEEYLNELFGSDQLYLDLLATHPDFQLQGAGTRLVSRGLDIGWENRLDVTLMSQPTAASFYVHLGFDSIGNITISSVDEDEYFGFNIMAYNFAPEEEYTM